MTEPKAIAASVVRKLGFQLALVLAVVLHLVVETKLEEAEVVMLRLVLLESLVLGLEELVELLLDMQN